MTPTNASPAATTEDATWTVRRPSDHVIISGADIEDAAIAILTHDDCQYAILVEQDGLGWRLWHSNRSRNSTAYQGLVETWVWSGLRDEDAARAEIFNQVVRHADRFGFSAEIKRPRFAVIDMPTGYLWWVGDAMSALHACHEADAVSGREPVRGYLETGDENTGRYAVHQVPEDFKAPDGRDPDQIKAATSHPLVGYFRVDLEG